MSWGTAQDRDFFYMEGYEYGKTHTTYTEDQLIPIPHYYHKAWIEGFNFARTLAKATPIDYT